jgi:hypothetical protein
LEAVQATDDITRCMRFACWITKVTDTHSDYVILIHFSTEAMVTRTRPNVTFKHTFALLLYFNSSFQIRGRKDATDAEITHTHTHTHTHKPTA